MGVERGGGERRKIEDGQGKIVRTVDAVCVWGKNITVHTDEKRERKVEEDLLSLSSPY